MPRRGPGFPILENVDEYDIEYTPHFFPERLHQIFMRWSGGAVSIDKPYVLAHPDTVDRVLEHYLVNRRTAGRDPNNTNAFDLFDYTLRDDPTMPVGTLRVRRFDVAVRPPKMTFA